jgi:hypothetical protein
VATTLPDAPSVERVRRVRWVRRAGATALVLFVLAGAVGAFGTRTSSAAAESAGYRVEVTYPNVSRPGHAVRFSVHVHHAGGFDDPVRVRMETGYFDLFDENAFDPDPARQTSDARFHYFEYSPPAGEDFVISSDTRVEPDRQRGEAGSVSVLDDKGAPVVTVRFRTRIFP